MIGTNVATGHACDSLLMLVVSFSLINICLEYLDTRSCKRSCFMHYNYIDK